MNHRQQFRRMCTLVLTGLLTIGLAPQAWTQPSAIISALSMVPIDAPIAVVVPSLSGLNHKLAKLNEQGLDSAVPHLRDLLGTFKQMSGITQGLNDNGSLIAFLTDAQALTNVQAHTGPPPMIILAAVLDYAAFVSQLGGNPNEAVTRLNIPGGSVSFAKKVGQFAAIGPNSEQLLAYQPGTKKTAAMLIQRAGKVGSGCLATSDAVILINIEAMDPVLGPKLEAGLSKVSSELDKVKTGSPLLDRLIKPIATIYGDSAKALLRDTSTVVIGLDITNKGVGVSYTAQFKHDTYLAQIFSAGTGAAGQLARLQNQDYWFASAINFQGIAINTLMKDFASRFPNQEDDPLTDAIQSVTTMMQQTIGMANVYALPDQLPMMGGGSLFSGVTLYETTDGQAYRKSIQAYFESFQRVINELNQAPMVNPIAPQGMLDLNVPKLPLNIKLTYSPNVLQLDAMQVDEYAIEYQLPPNMMKNMGPAAPMMAMMGGTSQSGYLAVKDSYAVMTTVRDLDLLKKALAAVGQKTGLGTSGPIQRVRQSGLPANTIIEWYLNLSGIIKGANMFMGMMGQQPIQVPEDLSPIASAVSAENHGLIGRLFVPIDVIRFCKDAVDQAQRMFGGVQAAPGGPQQPHPHTPGPPPAPF